MSKENLKETIEDKDRIFRFTRLKILIHRLARLQILKEIFENDSVSYKDGTKWDTAYTKYLEKENLIEFKDVYKQYILNDWVLTRKATKFMEQNYTEISDIFVKYGKIKPDHLGGEIGSGEAQFLIERLNRLYSQLGL